MHTDHLHPHLAAFGAKLCHSERILRAWLQGKPLDAGPRHQPAEHYLPLSVRTYLPELAKHLARIAQVKTQHPASDGCSKRLLIELQDAQLIESVLLPRGGLCVSSQVGCAVGCLFCMTGRSGLIRHLDIWELLAQVALARTLQPVRRVVFMGMGEPSHNLEAVLNAIELLGTYGEIGHKNLVLSSVGDRRLFQRLPHSSVKPALALSLHSTYAQVRQKLLPHAQAISPAELMELGEHYAQQSGHPIQYQWTVLAGINDTQDELDNLLQLFRGKYAILNLIPYNSTETDGFQRPSQERVIEMLHYLHRRGVLTKIRNSAGQDIDGGCGQLRARAQKKAKNKPATESQSTQAQD